MPSRDENFKAADLRNATELNAYFDNNPKKRPDGEIYLPHKTTPLGRRVDAARPGSANFLGEKTAEVLRARWNPDRLIPIDGNPGKYQIGSSRETDRRKTDERHANILKEHFEAQDKVGERHTLPGRATPTGGYVRNASDIRTGYLMENTAEVLKDYPGYELNAIEGNPGKYKFNPTATRSELADKKHAATLEAHFKSQNEAGTPLNLPYASTAPGYYPSEAHPEGRRFLGEETAGVLRKWGYGDQLIKVEGKEGKYQLDPNITRTMLTDEQHAAELEAHQHISTGTDRTKLPGISEILPPLPQVAPNPLPQIAAAANALLPQEPQAGPLPPPSQSRAARPWYDGGMVDRLGPKRHAGGR